MIQLTLCNSTEIPLHRARDADPTNHRRRDVTESEVAADSAIFSEQRDKRLARDGAYAVCETASKRDVICGCFHTPDDDITGIKLVTDYNWRVGGWTDFKSSILSAAREPDSWKWQE